MRQQSKKYFDYFGLSYFTTVAAMMFLSIFYSMPRVYQENMDSLRNRQALSVFLLIEVMVNFFLVLKNKSYYLPQDVLHNKRQFGTDLMSNSCATCLHFIPSRAHHCPLCERCVLKRDHHCFFVGTCVGFYNQRYFVVFCFYCTIASMYGLYVNFYYLMIVYSYTESSLWNFCPPVTLVRWLFGLVSSDMLYHVALTYLCAITAMGVGGIFVSQFVLVVLGCTTYEFWRMERIFRRCSVWLSLYPLEASGGYFGLAFATPPPWCIERYLALTLAEENYTR